MGFNLESDYRAPNECANPEVDGERLACTSLSPQSVCRVRSCQGSVASVTASFSPNSIAVLAGRLIDSQDREVYAELIAT